MNYKEYGSFVIRRESVNKVVSSILFDTEKYAILIYDQMVEMVSDSGYMSALALARMLATVSVYDTHAVGWEDLSDLKISELDGKFVIELPKEKWRTK